VVGIYLPMIPEVVVAMLACARIGAPHNVVFGGFSAEAVRERMEFSEARALITADGAARKGKTAAVKDRVDEVMGDLESLERIVVVRSKGTPCKMQAGRDVFYDEILAAAEPDCRPSRWTPSTSVHPLHLRLHRKAQGILHTTGGYLTVSPRRTGMYSTCAPAMTPIPTCTGAQPTSAGSPATPTSSTGPSPTGPRRSCGGSTRLPQPGHLVGDRRALQGQHPLLRSNRHSRVHQVGASWPNAHDLSSLRLLGTVGEPINPKAWLWYHR